MAEPLDLPVRSVVTGRDDSSRRNVTRTDSAATPVTPPTRYISSTYSTPGSTFGQEQDAIIIELNPRYIKAGIEGESYPQCCWHLTPSASKRIDDYREYLPSHVQPKDDLERWGEGYELWRNDIRALNLGLVSDNLERAVREINNRRLLVDAANSRLVLVVPPLLPHPVLATILQTIFERWTYPSITLLPRPAMALVAAGLRSGLVVDIDWEETVVTVIYEYREVKSFRTTRAMKTMTRNVAAWIKQSLQASDRFDLEFVEEVLKRAANRICAEDVRSERGGKTDMEDNLVIDWPTNSFSRLLILSRGGLRAQIHDTMLGKNEDSFFDEEELPLQHVMYNALRAVSPEVRGVCISRIVFTGAGSEEQALLSTILDSFTKLVDERGWTGVQGLHLRELQKHRARRTKQVGPVEPNQPGRDPTNGADGKNSSTPERMLDAERHLRERTRNQPPVIHGSIRQVETLGVWSGASLITSLKVKSFVEIQRERFLHHGLNGATRELDLNFLQQQGRGPLVGRSKAGERTSWTLSGWA